MGEVRRILPLFGGQAAHHAGQAEAQSQPGQAIAALFPDGRLHLQHGPIDIIAEVWGNTDAVGPAYARAAARFSNILRELVAELEALRAEDAPLNGAIAQRMAAAVAPYRPSFITPMAAVAGAVAEEVLQAMLAPAQGGITRAQVNNGGDIALYLAPGQSLTCALAASMGRHRAVIHAGTEVRGIATSGWRGRSHSLGIADAVTVLARTAAMADAAATMIANAVDLPGHPAITRRPARDLQCDSDLGERLVTVAVAPLSTKDRADALNAGLEAAKTYLARGLIESAALYLQGEHRFTQGRALIEEGRING